MSRPVKLHAPVKLTLYVESSVRDAAHKLANLPDHAGNRHSISHLFSEFVRAEMAKAQVSLNLSHEVFVKLCGYTSHHKFPDWESALDSLLSADESPDRSH